MRKFIIKNRQKRKYVKRQQVASSFSLPDLIVFGLIPAAFIAVGFLIMTSLKPSSFHLNVDTPSISLLNLYQSLINFLKEIYNGLIQSIASISFSEVEINYNPIISIAKTGELLSLSYQAFFDFITFISQTTAFAFNEMARTVTFVIDGIIYISALVAATVVLVVQTVSGFLVSVFEFTIILIQELINALIFLYETIVASIVSVIGLITNKIASISNSIISTIKSPFMPIVRYIVEMQPFFNLIGSSFQIAVDDLNTGFTNILNITSSRTII